jgi:catalase-peroxidase
LTSRLKWSSGRAATSRRWGWPTSSSGRRPSRRSPGGTARLTWPSATGEYCGPEPEAASLEEQGLGRTNRFRTGKGPDTITSGLEGAWTSNPVQWDNGYFENLFGYEWALTKSPAGAYQWTPKDPKAQRTVPDAHDPSRRHAPIMFTTDLDLRMDPVYGPIAKRFHEHSDQFAEAFAKAWYKLTHRDMGPVSRLLGPLVPRRSCGRTRSPRSITS